MTIISPDAARTADGLDDLDPSNQAGLPPALAINPAVHVVGAQPDAAELAALIAGLAISASNTMDFDDAADTAGLPAGQWVGKARSTTLAGEKWQAGRRGNTWRWSLRG